MGLLGLGISMECVCLGRQRWNNNAREGDLIIINNNNNTGGTNKNSRKREGRIAGNWNGGKNKKSPWFNWVRGWMLVGGVEYFWSGDGNRMTREALEGYWNCRKAGLELRN